MRYRPLGRTGISVSEIGFGAWGIGGATPGSTSYGPTDDRESLRALGRALDLGITFFDTAAVYGYGRSEELIAEAVAGRRSGVVIATKAGLVEFGKAPDFTPRELDRSLERSLTRLRTDYVDLFQLHNPPANVLADPDAALESVGKARRAGKIRAFGVSVRSPEDGLVAIARARPDAIQVNFNLLDQRILDSGLAEAAHAAGVAIIARTPLCFGFLTGRIDESTVFRPDDHRSRWPRSQIRHWAEGARRMMSTMAEPANQTPTQYALRYCLSHPAVASTIPGILSAAEAEENCHASLLGSLGPGEHAAIRAAYRECAAFEGAQAADPGKA